MLRLSRFLVVVSLLVTVLLAAVPVQAATPELTRSAWTSVLAWWDALAASFGGEGGEEESGLAVAVGNEGASTSISPDGFAAENGDLDAATTQESALDPEEPTTEEGPRISPNG